jgi:hypothetical protein
MTAGRAALVLRANAVFDFAAGLLLLTGTWDGLWDALDLPQGRPAVFVQVGGAALWGFAYLLWRAADNAALRAPVSLAGALADGLAGVIVLVWLVSDHIPGGVGDLGHAILIALVVVMAAFTALKLRIATARVDG